MKIRMMKEELYPMYIFDDKYGVELEVSAEQIAEWKKIFKDFSRTQSQIEKLYEKAEQGDIEKLYEKAE